MNAIKMFILRHDIFGYDFGVRFEKHRDTNYPTITGGVVSVVLKFVILTQLWVNFGQLVEGETDAISSIRRVGYDAYKDSLHEDEDIIF